MKDIKVTLIGLELRWGIFSHRVSLEKLGLISGSLQTAQKKRASGAKRVTVNTINYRFPIITPDVEGDPADPRYHCGKGI